MKANRLGKIRDGDKVVIDTDHVKNNPDYKKLSTMYKLFCFENQDRVFTARKTNIAGLIELEESPTWLFSELDLIKVDNAASSRDFI